MSPDMPLPPSNSLAATRFTIGDFDVSFVSSSLRQFYLNLNFSFIIFQFVYLLIFLMVVSLF